MKYKKGNQSYCLDDCKLMKIRMHDRSIGAEGTFAENIWAKRFKNESHVVLQNTAVAFTPFPSLGAIIPTTTEFDFIAMLQGGELEIHPEVWPEYVKQGYINEQGEYLKAP